MKKIKKYFSPIDLYPPYLVALGCFLKAYLTYKNHPTIRDGWNQIDIIDITIYEKFYQARVVKLSPLQT